ncbi:MAG: hypothetical protein IJE53_04690 [Bacilli bacterium]|nr:hypothetical protein [Bacilli bacterium]
MGLFSKRKLFDKTFLLDDKSLLFKNCINFSYSNIYNDNYVVQGFTISRDYCMISAYNKFKAKSRIYLYEKNGVFKKYVDLDNSAHVGGIAYDYINDIVFVTGSWGVINAYSYPELIGGNIARIECNLDISKVISGVTSAATIYFYDNKLYACTFEGVGKMVVFDLDISRNKVKVVNEELISNLPSAIQGICVFKHNDKLYYLFSQSFSRLHSIIKLFDDSFNFLGQYKLKEIGLEGIDIDYSGNVCGVFENGIDRTRKVHLSDIVQRRSNMLDKKYCTKGVYFQEKLVNLKENV